MGLQLPYNPDLKEAMAKIRAIIKEYDIGALVILHKPGHGECLKELQPSYSIISAFDKEKIHFTSKLQEMFGGDMEAKLAADTATANMLSIFQEILIDWASQFHIASQFLDAKLKAEHTTGTSSTRQEQDN